MPEDVAFLDLEIQEHAGSDAAEPVVFQQPELELYQRLVEAARNQLADLELEFGIAKSKVYAIRSKLFGALRTYNQERNRLRVLVNFRKAFIERLLAEGEEATEATTGDYQRVGICDLLVVFPKTAGEPPGCRDSRDGYPTFHRT
jgi:hypothetical protein